MSGAPDGISMHTDDQAAILCSYPESLRYLYGHVQTDVQMHASQIDYVLLRTYGCPQFEKQRCWLVCRHTTVIKSGHTILHQGTLCLYSILGWMHTCKILKKNHHEQHAVQLDVGLGPAHRERGCACPHVWHSLGFAHLIITVRRVGKTRRQDKIRCRLYLFNM